MKPEGSNMLFIFSTHMIHLNNFHLSLHDMADIPALVAVAIGGAFIPDQVT